MSRKEAKNVLTLEEYQETMKGIYTTSINNKTLDEAPMAYKSLEDSIDSINDSVNIVEVLKPVYNYKASEWWDKYSPSSRILYNHQIMI